MNNGNLVPKLVKLMILGQQNNIIKTKIFYEWDSLGATDKKKKFLSKKRDFNGKGRGRSQKQPPKNPTPQMWRKIFCGRLKTPISVFG